MKKTRGGPGSREEPRLREDDSGTEVGGEKVPGQNKARRVVKETFGNDRIGFNGPFDLTN